MKLFSISLILMLMIFSEIAYLSTNPRPREQFLEAYILGSDRRARGYYPEGSSTISLNSSVKWYLGISNLMDSIQLVVVKVKLGTEFTEAPNKTSATPANLPVLFEYRHVLTDNETREFPFSWRVLGTRTGGNLTYLTINMNETVTTVVNEIGARDAKNYRLIIELWTLDKQTGQEIFGWRTSDNKRGALWLQMWFDVRP